MSLDDDTRVDLRAFDEMVMEGNFDNIEEIVHYDYGDYIEPRRRATDRAGIQFQIEYFRSAFPDIHGDFFEDVAGGNLVVHRRLMSGTRSREFFGVAPQGTT